MRKTKLRPQDYAATEAEPSPMINVKLLVPQVGYFLVTFIKIDVLLTILRSKMLTTAGLV